MVSAASDFSLRTRVLNVFRQVFQMPALEPLVAKWMSADERPHWIAKVLPNHYQFPKPSIRKVTRHGINYELDIGDFLDWHVYYGLDEGNKHFLYELAKAGDVVLDVGANFGETVFMLSQKVGSAGRVFAFEPDPMNYEKLKKNEMLNSFSQLSCYQLAVSDEARTYSLYRLSERNPAGNRILAESGPNSVQVSAVRLDDFLKENSVSRVALIKIDVEGFESHVLRGATKTLKEFRPTLFIELDDLNLREQGDSAADLVRFLEGFSYRIFRAGTQKELTSKSNFENCHYDIICFPR
jgi:FkbM family methyltransferase